MPGVIDLRQDVAVDIANAQAIGNIFKAVGRAEQNRQKRFQIDRVMSDISNGIDPMTAIQNSRTAGPVPYNNGLAGVGQRFGRLLGGTPDATDDLTEQILMGKLKQSMTMAANAQDPLYQAQVKATEALGTQRENKATQGPNLQLKETAEGYGAFNPDTGEIKPISGATPKVKPASVKFQDTDQGLAVWNPNTQQLELTGFKGKADQTQTIKVLKEGKNHEVLINKSTGEEIKDLGEVSTNPVYKPDGKGNWFKVEDTTATPISGGMAEKPQTQGDPQYKKNLDQLRLLQKQADTELGSAFAPGGNMEAYNKTMAKIVALWEQTYAPTSTTPAATAPTVPAGYEPAPATANAPTSVTGTTPTPAPATGEKAPSPPASNAQVRIMDGDKVVAVLPQPPAGQVVVRDKDGNFGSIPREDIEKAMRNGYTVYDVTEGK